jgi:uncharacterized OB-fold protein
MITKPIPAATAESLPFWDAAKAERLIFQHCTDCCQAQYYPRILCSHCGSRSLEWRESERNGTIHALTEVHIPAAAFKDDAPYYVALVDMDEGFRMLLNIVGSPGEVAIGDRGEVVFEQRGEAALPHFRKIVL